MRHWVMGPSDESLTPGTSIVQPGSQELAHPNRLWRPWMLYTVELDGMSERCKKSGPLYMERSAEEHDGIYTFSAFPLIQVLAPAVETSEEAI